MIQLFNLTNYGNINETLNITYQQVGTDYDDVKDPNNPVHLSTVDLPINSMIQINLSHIARPAPKDFIFNMTIGTKVSQILLRIMDMPPIISFNQIHNSPIEQGTESRVSFGLSDEQPGTLTNYCNYTYSGSTDQIAAISYLGSYSCFYTPTDQGTAPFG